MTKQKRQKRSRSKPGLPRFRRPVTDLSYTFSRVNRLVEQGRTREAITLIQSHLQSNPYDAEAHAYLGTVRLMIGDVWNALDSYEQAQQLSQDSNRWLPLASIYLQLGLNSHALHTFRQIVKANLDSSARDEARQVLASLEQEITGAAQSLGLPLAQMEKGLRDLEEGQRALQRGDFPASVEANRQAINLLGDWPPPHNNLSLALFFQGRPEEAIEVAGQVLSRAPDNLQALSNSIRFLAWTGQEEAARALWPRLREIRHIENSDRLKKAEAAAILNQDESVQETLSPLDKPGLTPGEAPGPNWQIQLFLAVAEANTGQSQSARRRLKALQPDLPWAGELLAALQAGRPGPGWAQRFPYFHSTELMPRRKMEEFIELVGRQDKLSPKQFHQQVADFAASYPQLVLLAEKLIWEENQAEAGIGLLDIIATPAAYAALHRFGLSQAGEDDTRLQVLLRLMEAGQIGPDEKLQVWNQGRWQEVELRKYEISGERDLAYSPAVQDLLDQAQTALEKNQDKKAERLLRRLLELDSEVKEAFNNLGVIYARREQHHLAREMYQAAVEIDPTYVFPRGNLALYYLNEKNVEAARATLAPLADKTRLHPLEMAFYSYVQARLLTEEKQYDAARDALKVALEVWPDYEPAKSLLEHLEQFSELQANWDSYMARQRQRDQAKRARLQAELTTPAPALSEALPLYSKDVLTGIARVVLPEGGWSALKKAGLAQEIAAGLADRQNLERLVNGLAEDQRAALGQVLTEGGSMAWQAFETRYDNDLEESPYWNWHEPKTVMGQLRRHGLLVEATVEGEIVVTIPAELRQDLAELLG